MDPDPRTQVEAPVRGALVGIMVRGIVLVGAMAALALWPVIARPEVALRDAIAEVAVVLLLGYAIGVRLARRLGGRPPVNARERAWERAKEIDADDASLGLLVTGWVPVALLLAVGLLLWPHVTDPNPGLAAAWVVIGLPPFAAAWMLATTTWMEACRDDLARAEQEADSRLRRYWANVGR